MAINCHICLNVIHISVHPSISWKTDCTLYSWALSALRYFRACSKFCKVVIKFAWSVCMHETTQEPLNGCSWNLILGNIICCTYSRFFWNWTKSNGHFSWRPVFIFVCVSSVTCYNLFRANLFRTKIVERMKHISYVPYMRLLLFKILI
jgi:hypothetical protein